MSTLNCDDTASIVTMPRGVGMSSKWRNLRTLDKALLGTVAAVALVALALIITVGVQGSRLRHMEEIQAAPLAPSGGGSSRPTTNKPSETSGGHTSASGRPVTPQPYRSTTTTEKQASGTPCDAACDKLCLEADCVEMAGNMLRIQGKRVSHPCDDFYEYACGQWGDVNLIPDSETRWDQFDQSRELIARAVQDLLMHDKDIHLRPEPIQDAKKFYDDCVHQDNENNYTQLKLHIDHMLTDLNKDLAMTLGKIRRMMGRNYLFQMTVDKDERSSTKNAIYLDAPNVMVSPLHTPKDPFEVHYEQQYTTLMTQVWAEVFGVNRTVAAEKAASLLHFEKVMAQFVSKYEPRSNETHPHKVLTVEELYLLTEAEGKTFSWISYFDEVFAEIFDPVDQRSSWNKTLVVVKDEHYLHVFESLFNAQDTAPVLQDYLTWRIIFTLIEDSSEKLRDIYFDYQISMYQMESPMPMWRTCAQKTQEHFEMALTFYYVEEYFDEDLKALVLEMIEHLKNTLKTALRSPSTLPWMSRTVKKEAIAKIDSLKLLIGFPDWLLDPSNNTNVFTSGLHEYYYHLTLDLKNDHLDNILELLEWKSKEDLKMYTKPTTSEKWLYDPLDVTIVYSPKHHSITVPAGILQPPFFFGNSLRYLNYGALGTLIAHDLVHVFAHSGKEYKPDGTIGSSWDAETETGYRKAVQCYEHGFSNYTTPDEPIALSWRQTLVDEAVADSLSVKLSHLAYKMYEMKSGVEKVLPGLGHTQDQLFFLSYAQMYCETWRKKYSTHEGDKITPPQFRERSGLFNSEEFNLAWGCKNTSNIKPCHLW